MGSASTTKAFQRRDEIIINLLGTIQRERDLNDDESALLERTVRRITPKREVWRWSADEDQILIDFANRRARLGRTPPFQQNDEIRQIAKDLGRTEWAIYRRIERLRLGGKAPQTKRYASRPPRVVKLHTVKQYDFTGTVDTAEAAAMLGVTEQWLKQKRVRGGGPKFVKMGRHPRYPLADLRKFPIQQIRDENESRSRGWLATTAAMDETGIGLSPIVQDETEKRTG